MKTWLIPVMALSLLVAPVQPWAVAQTVPAAPLVLAQSPAAEGGAVATPAQDFVAVLDLDALGGVSKDEALIITNRLRANLLKTGKYRILERAKMGEILKEQGFQESGLCDTTACSVELGRLLAVNRILSGSVSKIGNTYTLSIRLLDVEKGTVIKEEFEDCPVCELDTVLTRMTASLAVKMAGQQGDVNLKGSGFSANMPALKTGTLNLTSMPPGAEVFINGQQKGTTPLKLDLPAGSHKVMLGGSDFVAQTLDIDLRTGETLNKEVWMSVSQLGYAKYGVLQLNTQRKGVDVYVNGSIKGKTPLNLTLVPDQEYKLTLSHPDFVMHTETIIPKAGEVLTPDIKLTLTEIGRYKAYKQEEITMGWVTGSALIPGVQFGYLTQNEWGWFAGLWAVNIAAILLGGVVLRGQIDEVVKKNDVKFREAGVPAESDKSHIYLLDNFLHPNLFQDTLSNLTAAYGQIPQIETVFVDENHISGFNTTERHIDLNNGTILTYSLLIANYLFGAIHAPILANGKNEELRKKYNLTEEDIKRIEASGKVTYFYNPPAQNGFYFTGGDLFSPSVSLGYRHGF